MKQQAMKLVAVALSLFIPMWGMAQGLSVTWDKTIGGSQSDQLSDMALTPDGGYILGGSTTSNKSGDKADNVKGGKDYWIVKLSASGNIEWQKDYGGKLDDQLQSIQPTPDGGYIVGGTSNSGADGDKTTASHQGSQDYWILKLDKAGNIEWQKTIGGDKDDRLSKVYPTPDGGYIAGGGSASNKSGDKSEDQKGVDPRDPGVPADYWIVKLDKGGNIEWDRTYGGGGPAPSTAFLDLAIAKDGYLLGGYSMAGKGNDKTEDGRGNYDYWIIKINDKGDVQWDKTIGGDGGDQLHNVMATQDGGFLLGGNSDSKKSGEKTEDATKSGYSDYWLVKVDASGKIEWDKKVGSNGTDNLFAISQTTDGGYFLTGQSGGNISGEKSEDVRTINGTNYWIVKTDDNGKAVWDKTLGVQNDRQAVGLQTSDGYIVAGTSRSNKGYEKSEDSRGDDDYWVVKLEQCQTTVTNVDTAICDGESYTLPWGTKVTQPGTYKDTLISGGGCDSIIITSLSFNKIDSTSVSATICNGDAYNLPGGGTATIADTYIDTLTGVISGCDSIVITTLSVTTIDTAVTRSGTTLSAKAGATVYQWIDCATGQELPGATGQTYTPEQNGSYAVVLTKGDCSDTSACYEVEVPAGIGQTLQGEEQALILYPNPADAQVTLKSNNGFKLKQVTLMSITGKVLYQTGTTEHSIRLDTRPYAAGTYLIRATLSGGAVSYYKLQINR